MVPAHRSFTSGAWVLALLVCVPASLFGAPVDRRTSTLAWVRLPGAERCIGPVELAQAVENRLGRQVFSPVSQADLAVEGRIEPRGSGFAASLSVSDREGTVLGSREHAGVKADCRSMDRALVLVTSLLIDPDAFANDPKEAEAVPSKAPPADVSAVPKSATSTRSARPATPEAAPLTPSELTEPAAPWWIALSLSGALAVGPLPGVSPGIGASFDLGSENGLRGRASALLQYGPAETSAGTEAGFMLVAGSVSACYTRLAPGFGSLGACAGLELGALLAESSGLVGGQAQTAFWIATTLGVHADWTLSEAWFVRGALDLLVPLRRDRFTYQDGAGASQLLFEPSPVAGRVSAGIGLRL